MNPDINSISMSGFLLIDKPAGISSFKMQRHIKSYFKGRKVGFAGTLDPDATGLMIVGIGQATRMLSFFESMRKTYRFNLIPGISTDTYDMSGEIVKKGDVSGITRDSVESAIGSFKGLIEQMPPVYSAIKINGKRACDRTRKGEEVVLKTRQVTIYDLFITEWNSDKWSLEMCCSKGAYVRSVAHDLGNKLGCGGAASEIRRVKIGDFDVESAGEWDNPDGFNDLLPMEAAVRHLASIVVNQAGVSDILHGRAVRPDMYTRDETSVLEEENLLQILDTDNKLLALGELSFDNSILPKKVFADSDYLKSVH